MNHVVIVAGGKGLRMGTDIPKQFLPIGGLPVLMRTMLRFREYDGRMGIVLVLPESQQDYWRRLCERYSFNLDYRIANGGKTRFHSVKNGLALVPDGDGVVGVHDGVRPFASVEMIARCYGEAERSGAAVPAVAVVETLRHIVVGGSETVPRGEYRLVQTPQAFGVALLKKAYAQEYREAFTDDASVVEALGHKVALVEGNRENIKITTPFDLSVAEAIIQTQNNSLTCRQS